MSITVIRTNTSGARGEVAAYLADANNRVEENGTPAIPPPTEDQLQEPVFPPQEPSPKRKRGRPSKSSSEETTPKKPRGKLTNEQRERLIAMYQKGHSLADIAEAFGISKSHAYTVGRSGQAEAKPRGGAKNVKMTQEASALLACELQKNPQCTGKELVKVLSSSGIHVTPSTVNRHLVSGAMVRDGYPNFTFKRLSIHHEERYSERVKEARVEYIKSYSYYKEKGTVFIFIDETHFRATDFRYYGRAPVGERAISRKRVTRISVTAITAITSVGAIPHTMFVRGTVNQHVFQVFIHELVKELDTDSFHYTIIMDNAPIHKTTAVKSLIGKKKFSFIHSTLEL